MTYRIAIKKIDTGFLVRVEWSDTDVESRHFNEEADATSYYSDMRRMFLTGWRDAKKSIADALSCDP